MTHIDFNSDYATIAKQLHQFNLDKGWWDEYLDDKTKRFETAMMLVVSELSEAMEGCRKDLMDDKLPAYPMFEVELADAAIRLLDMAGAYDIGDLRDPIYKEHKDRLIGCTKPEQLYRVVKIMFTPIGMAGAIYEGLTAIIALAEIHSIDLKHVMKMKTNYNAVRADHLRENREKAGGKKF